MDFQTRYDKLNDNQQAAVNTIHGPLLVIAGPGTGKTELLSMRAAQILRQTDTLPSNILCLTFTDSGAVNMRQRLQQIIGEDAYRVAIHTFHSFGTDIISQNRQYFFRGADMQPTDELTQQQILQQLFEQFDWNHPLSPKNNNEFIYLKETLRIISEFKQSGLSADELRQIISDTERTIGQIAEDIRELFQSNITKNTIPAFGQLATRAAEIPASNLPSSVTPYANVLSLSMVHAAQEAIDSGKTKSITAWKSTWCKKDTKGDFIFKDAEALPKLMAVIDVYESYVAELERRRLFDYDDMILSVLQACERHHDLRANLQEQYQFIMVDEFQDTNLAQLRLLFNLTGNEPAPNIMAVGDDDQAIFSFQGANVGNIQRFRQHYHDPQVVVLTDNYRSAAQILTAARAVITQGTDRLENTIADLSKELTAQAPNGGAEVSLQQFAAVADERAGVAEQIARLIKTGEKPENIAVLARRHVELIELLPHLYQQGIRVNYEHHDDILEMDAIKALELTTRVVVALYQSDLDTANALLPQLVAHPAFGFSAIDIWKLSLAAWRGRQLWLETMLANSTFEPLANWLLERAKDVPNETLEEQLDALLGTAENLSGDSVQRLQPERPEAHGVKRGVDGNGSPQIPTFHNYYFNSDRLAEAPDAYLTTLDALRTIRQKLRDHYANQPATLQQFIEFIDLHRSTNTRLTSIRPAADSEAGAINLMTAHKAKGLEFPHVFIIGAIDGAWGEKVRVRSRLIRYPANLQLQPAGATYDERLRLFFVAMTRAKTTLHISYAATDKSGKDSLIASFLSSIELEKQTVAAPDITAATTTAHTDWQHSLVSPITADLRQVLAPILDNYKLSATHLNNFLDVSRGGPQTFLLNNLLRFPQAKSTSASYGTAMHAALQFAHDSLRADGQPPERQAVLEQFRRYLARQHLAAADFADLYDKGQAALTAFLDAHQATFRPTQLTELNFAGQGVMVGQARLTGALDLADIDPEEKTIFVTDYKTGKPSASWRGVTDYEKIKLHKYRQQLMFYQLLVTQSQGYSGYTFTGGRLQFVEPDPQTGEILALEEQFSGEELAEFTRLIDIVWQRIMHLDLPDISGYSADYKGMAAFERNLLEGVI